MKKIIPNDWSKVRAFYEEHGPTILAGDRWEWAIPAYSWEECGGFRMTPIEAWLWSDIRAANAVLYPQYPVAGFFVDFANPVARVAIECDGHQYHLDKAKDRERDQTLARLGWTVYRISGHDCMTEADDDTGAPGAAALFIRDIVERHLISRNHRPNQSEGWFHFGRGCATL